MTRTTWRALRFGAICAGALVCIGAVGRASRWNPWRVSDRSRASRIPVDSLGTAVFTTLSVLGMFIVGVAIWMQVTGRVEKPQGGKRAPWYQQALTLFVLILILGAISRFRSENEEPPLAERAIVPPIVNAARSEPRQRDPSLDDRWVALMAAAATVAGIVTFIRLDRRRRAAPGFEDDVVFDDVSSAVESALDETLSTLAPRAAIIGAFASMERGFATAGLVRARSETAAEYVRRVLTSYTGPVSSAVRSRGRADPDSDDITDDARPAIERLTQLYLDARFSEHEVTETAREEAIHALETVLTALRQDRTDDPGNDHLRPSLAGSPAAGTDA